VRYLGIIGIAPIGIRDHWLKRERKFITGSNFIDGEKRAVRHRTTNGGIGASRGKQQSYMNDVSLPHLQTKKIPAGLRRGLPCLIAIVCG
jgi:hypothetical protein